jgi:hypothetical protein
MAITSAPLPPEPPLDLRLVGLVALIVIPAGGALAAWYGVKVNPNFFRKLVATQPPSSVEFSPLEGSAGPVKEPTRADLLNNPSHHAFIKLSKQTA